MELAANLKVNLIEIRVDGLDTIDFSQVGQIVADVLFLLLLYEANTYSFLFS